VELVVALAVLGTSVAVVGLAIRSLQPPSSASAALAAMASARERAILTGQPVVYTLDGQSVRFAPDGSAGGGPLLTDSLVLFVDRLTGEVRSEPR
jgi:hypothetical protein